MDVASLLAMLPDSVYQRRVGAGAPALLGLTRRKTPPSLVFQRLPPASNSRSRLSEWTKVPKALTPSTRVQVLVFGSPRHMPPVSPATKTMLDCNGSALIAALPWPSGLRFGKFNTCVQPTPTL